MSLADEMMAKAVHFQQLADKYKEQARVQRELERLEKTVAYSSLPGPAPAPAPKKAARKTSKAGDGKLSEVERAAELLKKAGKAMHVSEIARALGLKASPSELKRLNKNLYMSLSRKKPVLKQTEPATYKAV